MIRVNTVLQNQMIIKWLILIGISVDIIQGIKDEKNMMAEIESVPIMNLVSRLVSTTTSEGTNISIRFTTAAFAASSGSGICNMNVNG